MPQNCVHCLWENRCFVVITTILFSLPDFLGTVGLGEVIAGVQSYIPLSKFSMGWVLPALVVFVGSNLVGKNQEQTQI